MTEVPINSSYYKDMLAQILEHTFRDGIIKSDAYYNEHMMKSPHNAEELGKELTSDDYLTVMMEEPNHIGFPLSYYSLPCEHIREYGAEHDKMYNFIKRELPAVAGVTSNAVYTYYPPKGFIGWHTNENNGGYQLLFTWSETGDGYFKYYDKSSQKVITLQDKAGWVCRSMYFGHDYEPDHICWHSAYTECDRVTVALKVTGNKDDLLAQEQRDMFLEDVQSEE